MISLLFSIFHPDAVSRVARVYPLFFAKAEGPAPAELWGTPRIRRGKVKYDPEEQGSRPLASPQQPGQNQGTNGLGSGWRVAKDRLDSKALTIHQSQSSA